MCAHKRYSPHYVLSRLQQEPTSEIASMRMEQARRVDGSKAWQTSTVD